MTIEMIIFAIVGYCYGKNIHLDAVSDNFISIRECEGIEVEIIDGYFKCHLLTQYDEYGRPTPRLEKLDTISFEKRDGIVEGLKRMANANFFE